MTRLNAWSNRVFNNDSISWTDQFLAFLRVSAKTERSFLYESLPGLVQSVGTLTTMNMSLKDTFRSTDSTGIPLWFVEKNIGREEGFVMTSKAPIFLRTAALTSALTSWMVSSCKHLDYKSAMITLQNLYYLEWLQTLQKIGYLLRKSAQISSMSGQIWSTTYSVSSSGDTILSGLALWVWNQPN